LAEATGGNPLLIRLALADDERVQGDATVVMRRAIEERAAGVGGRILALLVAAEIPLDEHELVRAAGKGAREAVADLRRHLVVARDAGRIAIVPPAAPLVREALGDADDAVWKSLARIGEAELAASAHDDAALLLAARARLELGDAERAIALVHEHPVARASAPTAALDRLLRDVAVRARTLASTSLRMLAREQLRVGDYDSAKRTLDELPAAKNREDAERIALLRAEASIRAGEPAAAQRALDALGERKNENPGVVLTRAQLAILRGEHAEARAVLERLAPRTNDVPQLEARRATQIAGSHLYEERYDLTHAWIGRARATQIAAGIPIEAIVTLLDVHALLGLGDVDRAEELLAREARGKPDAPALEVAALVRRGDLVKALETGDAAMASLDKRTDLLFRSVLARDLARAALGVGELARAAKTMRYAEAGADDPSLAALRPICDAELARIAEAEGDLSRARRWIERAHARIPGSPFIAIDREAMNGRVPTSARDAPAVVRGYAALRAAELFLAQAKLDDARDAAVVAERFYSGARLYRETARARVALAEALARLGDDGADETLASCEELAEARAYVPIAVACALVRAWLAESRGDLALAARAFEAAVRAAGETVDTAVERAASRLDVAVRAPRGDAAERKPYDAIVSRLGLARPAEVVWCVGPRTYLRAEADGAPERVACTIDVHEKRVDVAPGHALELPEQRVALLCALAEAGEGGATLEELFARVWRGTFHPLRHRNAVYVALTRLKDSLKPLGRDVRIAHDGDRYRLAGTLPVAVRRRADREGLRAALHRAAS
ncbi:MAG TPA: tetratricopeptide repeat protein, partial [Labilithrix sp.]